MHMTFVEICARTTVGEGGIDYLSGAIFSFWVIPYQINNKKSSPPQISLKIGTHVGSIGKPYQTKLYLILPLRYDRSIFEAIIYTSSFKQP